MPFHDGFAMQGNLRRVWIDKSADSKRNAKKSDIPSSIRESPLKYNLVVDPSKLYRPLISYKYNRY